MAKLFFVGFFIHNLYIKQAKNLKFSTDSNNLADYYMLKFFSLLNLLWLCASDCPLIPYPRSTLVSSLSVQFNGQRTQNYTYPLANAFMAGAVRVAVGVVGLQFVAQNSLSFDIQCTGTGSGNQLSFMATAQSNWSLLSFGFIATQNSIIHAGSEAILSFSVGAQPGRYAVYRPTPDSSPSQPIILKVFISGVIMAAVQLTTLQRQLQASYESFKKFSRNTFLIRYFQEAVQLDQATRVQLVNPKILGRLYTFGVCASGNLKMLRFSYVMWSSTVLAEKYNFLQHDFLLTDSQRQFSSINNIAMMLIGLTGFTFPRTGQYEFSITLRQLAGQINYRLRSNQNYLHLNFSSVAFEMKMAFACEDCPNSPIIYDSKFCVQVCPRSYSLSTQAGIKYCDRCDIDNLKVVDPDSNTCVCAKRHYINPTKGACQPCSYDCMSCSSSEVCLTCDNLLLQTKRKLSSLGRCLCPAVEYYDDKAVENIVCQKCHPNCLTCSGPRAHDCQSCMPGKQRNLLGFCVCQNGYVEDQSRNCLCPPPKFLNNHGVCLDNFRGPCTSNRVQQFIDLTKRCVCRQNTTQVLDECIECPLNSLFNILTLKCECQYQTMMVDGSCRGCSKNQFYDMSIKKCVCIDGTYQSSSGSCLRCGPKMALFDDQCQCIYNYYWSEEGCRRCKRESDGPRCQRNLE